MSFLPVLCRVLLVVGTVVVSTRVAHAGCPEILALLGNRVVAVNCFESTDLTTNNPVTTPGDNSIAGLPTGAFTPITDRAVIAPAPPDRVPITRQVPGIQVAGRFADDPTGQARFVMRLPADWNGRLVVAGASGTRSEHHGDFVWSDFFVQKGYAYATQNKGVLNLRIVNAASPTQPAEDPLSCRLNPASQTWVHFFDNDPEKPFTQWTHYMIEDAKLAKLAVVAHYRRPARFTYAVGISNGGYQVRRVIENAPQLFDAGLDWEGTHIDPRGPNLLTELPPAIANFPAYVASGFDPASAAARAIQAAGYAPDVVNGAASLWQSHWTTFWEVTQCQWQKRFDPAFLTYPGGVNDVTGTGGYNFAARAAADPSIKRALTQVATTGKIRRPMITISGTLDTLLPIVHHSRNYAALVRRESFGLSDALAIERNEDLDGPAGGELDPEFVVDGGELASADPERHDGRHRGRLAYRLYEVQNGNHIESLRTTFPSLELIQPHAHRAFDLLVSHVERGAALPPSQCIPRGGAIASKPAQRGQCANLKVP